MNRPWIVLNRAGLPSPVADFNPQYDLELICSESTS
jgi:hypothetical protein